MPSFEHSKQNRPHFDPEILDLQKQAISEAAFDLLGASLLFLVLTIGLLSAGISSNRSEFPIFIFGILPLILLAAVPLWFGCVRCFLLRRRIMHIRRSDTCEVPIVCRKVRFLLHPVGKTAYEIACVLLTSECGKTYHYLYPKGSIPTHAALKPLRQQLTGRSLTMICYRDTCLLKTLDTEKE